MEKRVERPDISGVELQELVSRTNFSEVWRGTWGPAGRMVAVKVAVGRSGRRMLETEMKLRRSPGFARLQGVVPLVADLTRHEPPHLVFQWMGEQTYRDLLEAADTAGKRARVMRVFCRLVGRVSDLHRAGYMHGDLKPENVLLDGHGNPWLTDFGMAREVQQQRLDGKLSNSLGTGSEWGGTLAYLPPEGLQGGEPHKKWDVFALGVMLHEALLGRVPDKATGPEQLKALLPEGCFEILRRSLAYSPDDRFRSASELWRRLEPLRDELSATGLRRWGHATRRFLTAGAAAFFVALRYLSVAALIGTYLWVIAVSVTDPRFLLLFIPVILLHLTIRWEGPETAEEHRKRTKGLVVSPLKDMEG